MHFLLSSLLTDYTFLVCLYPSQNSWLSLQAEWTNLVCRINDHELQGLPWMERMKRAVDTHFMRSRSAKAQAGLSYQISREIWPDRIFTPAKQQEDPGSIPVEAERSLQN